MVLLLLLLLLRWLWEPVDDQRVNVNVNATEQCVSVPLCWSVEESVVPTYECCAVTAVPGWREYFGIFFFVSVSVFVLVPSLRQSLSTNTARLFEREGEAHVHAPKLQQSWVAGVFRPFFRLFWGER